MDGTTEGVNRDRQGKPLPATPGDDDLAAYRRRVRVIGPDDEMPTAAKEALDRITDEELEERLVRALEGG